MMQTDDWTEAGRGQCEIGQRKFENRCNEFSPGGGAYDDDAERITVPGMTISTAESPVRSKSCFKGSPPQKDGKKPIKTML